MRAADGFGARRRRRAGRQRAVASSSRVPFRHHGGFPNEHRGPAASQWIGASPRVSESAPPFTDSRSHGLVSGLAPRRELAPHSLTHGVSPRVSVLAPHRELAPHSLTHGVSPRVSVLVPHSLTHGLAACQWIGASIHRLTVLPRVSEFAPPFTDSRSRREFAPHSLTHGLAACQRIGASSATAPLATGASWGLGFMGLPGAVCRVVRARALEAPIP